MKAAGCAARYRIDQRNVEAGAFELRIGGFDPTICPPDTNPARRFFLRPADS